MRRNGACYPQREEALRQGGHILARGPHGDIQSGRRRPSGVVADAMSRRAGSRVGPNRQHGGWSGLPLDATFPTAPNACPIPVDTIAAARTLAEMAELTDFEAVALRRSMGVPKSNRRHGPPTAMLRQVLLTCPSGKKTDIRPRSTGPEQRRPGYPSLAGLLHGTSSATTPLGYAGDGTSSLRRLDPERAVPARTLL